MTNENFPAPTPAGAEVVGETDLTPGSDQGPRRRLTKKEKIDALAESAADDRSGGGSILADAWRRLKVSPVFWVGLVIITAFVLLALFAGVIAPHGAGETLLIRQTRRATQSIAPPQPGFPLGGDLQGRDFFSRLVLGSRQTLIVGVLATLMGLTGGLILGILAGAFGGWVDTVIMRIVDVMLSIPSLLLAISIGALLGASQFTVIVAVSTVQIPVFARLLRGQMLAQRRTDHVLAARSLGVKQAPIVFRHMLPNSLSPVIVQATLVVALAIIDAAALSFLGLGSQDVTAAEWGQMLGEAQTVLDIHPNLVFWPAGCIVVIALGFTLLGESLREALDPKNRR